MIMNIYSIKDKLNGFQNIVLEHSDQSAIRTFGVIVKSKGTQYNEFPSDFDLYRIGAFDIDTGSIKSEKIPVYIESAIHFIKEVKE